ncbi:PEP-utilizing enzyme, partial [Planctomycetota bacterium]
VIVQRMVAADFAGVCFTRLPGEEDLIAVEVVRGLGESLVSGKSRPARICFSRETMEPISEDDFDGLLLDLDRETACLVARQALAAEAVFGFALDVEWAVKAGECFLLQARPITTSDVETERAEIVKEEIARLRELAGPKPMVWTDFFTADIMPHPKPLSTSLFLRGVMYNGGMGRAFRRLGFKYTRSASAGKAFEVICGRPFLNLSLLIGSMNADLPFVLDVRRALDGGGSGFNPASLPLKINWRDPGWLALPITGLRWITVVPWRFLRLRKTFRHAYTSEIYPALKEEATQLRGEDLTGLSVAELWERIVILIDRVMGDLAMYHQLSDIFAIGTHGLLRRSVVETYGDRADEVEVQLTTGLCGNFNTESNLALAKVASGKLWLPDFLKEYGHRGNPDWDVAAPRWREDPVRVEQLVKLVSRSDTDAEAQFEAQQEVRREAERAFYDDIGKQWWLRPLRKAIMRELNYYQIYSPLRETTQSACYMWIELIRQGLLEAGRRSDVGELLFYLELDEVARVLRNEQTEDLLERARARQRRLRLVRGIYVPHILQSKNLDAIGRVPELDKGTQELTGQVVSSGIAAGRARVVTDLEEAVDLKQGEILVTATTDPAWTPLFLVAGGLVLEQGAMLSHGAIVAREYGLPAIVNVAHATRIIRDGQHITLNANQGRVVLL